MQKKLLKLRWSFLILNNKNIPIRKKWGQNFLIDQNTINKIINLINPKIDENLIEVGPGKGAMTLNIINQSKTIHAIEIDPLLYKYLKDKNVKNLILYNEDILKWKPIKKIKYTKVFGNIPYNISSQIIFKFLKDKSCQTMIFMFQKELANRIISKQGNKDYGRISVMVQTFYKIEKKFNISKNVFYPKPKIDSSIIKFKKKQTKIRYDLYYKFIKECFKQRRKKLKNNLKDLYDINLIEKFANKRAEEISVKDFIKMYNKISI